VVEKEKIQDSQLKMTLSESLIRVPGITAQNRSQMAQDPQISTRGFGARSSFGVRGLRVYVDGIPLTMPDGIGQPGNIDLDVVRSIEVLRGPFSALYGNSSGGVIQLFTENAPKTPELSAGILFGSYDTKRQNVKAAGTSEGIEYLVNYSNFESNGYRDHSASQKEQGTAKFKINISEDTKLTTLVNWFDQDAQDPLGLNRVQAFSNPKSSIPQSSISNTRVSRSNTQAGFNLQHRIDENNSLNIMTYVGTRRNLQYLAIPSSVPVNANGRASEISREYYGTDVRWDNQGALLNKAYNLSLGLTYGKMNDDRLDVNADNGVMRAEGQTRRLNRDEKNIASNFDQYAQAKWSVLNNLDIHAGVRQTKVRLEIEDNFTSGLGNNGDNSGHVSYKKTTPVIGAVWKATNTLNFYTNYGKGFETPTFVETAFATTAPNSGPNLGLKPSTSRNLEIGAKAFIGSSTLANLSIFKTLTDDEIVIQDNNLGRTSYTNADKTKRNGAELSIDSRFSNNISLYGAYTLLNAKFDSDYSYTSNGNTNSVSSGNIIPGTYHNQIYAEIAWKHEASGFKTAFEARHNSKSYVDDLNSDIAPSYTIYNVRASFEQRLHQWRFTEFARVENIFDKEYIGSVRVNESSSRFYEPAAGSNYLVGLNANYSF
ncbi:MAG: TonB-dependent receptor family protein, partial [Methylophilaceae bacterium]|nr:TonB-dependent receptor [Methylotenera sp.]